MAAITLLKDYGSDSDSSIDSKETNITYSPKSVLALKEKYVINAAPLVETKVCY